MGRGEAPSLRQQLQEHILLSPRQHPSLHPSMLALSPPKEPAPGCGWRVREAAQAVGPAAPHLGHGAPLFGRERGPSQTQEGAQLPGGRARTETLPRAALRNPPMLAPRQDGDRRGTCCCLPSTREQPGGCEGPGTSLDTATASPTSSSLRRMEELGNVREGCTEPRQETEAVRL